MPSNPTVSSPHECVGRSAPASTIPSTRMGWYDKPPLWMTVVELVSTRFLVDIYYVSKSRKAWHPEVYCIFTS
uniref:Uncharacterized protein n=1 Tax=Plectus sambesii TaxID=2011161 RepID=A0A914USC7_9BILA